jgi:hypothetical protein
MSAVRSTFVTSMFRFSSVRFWPKPATHLVIHSVAGIDPNPPSMIARILLDYVNWQATRPIFYYTLYITTTKANLPKDRTEIQGRFSKRPSRSPAAKAWAQKEFSNP